MASAERPFDDRDLIKSVMLRATDQPKPIRAKVPDIDPRWEAAINRCLQRDPNGGSRRPENWRRGFGEAPGDPSDIGRVGMDPEPGRRPRGAAGGAEWVDVGLSSISSPPDALAGV